MITVGFDPVYVPTVGNVGALSVFTDTGHKGIVAARVIEPVVDGIDSAPTRRWVPFDDSRLMTALFYQLRRSLQSWAILRIIDALSGRGVKAAEAHSVVNLCVDGEIVRVYGIYRASPGARAPVLVRTDVSVLLEDGRSYPLRGDQARRAYRDALRRLREGAKSTLGVSDLEALGWRKRRFPVGVTHFIYQRNPLP